MRFRPCIDIHNGQVKQIVGSSLRDAGDNAEENFVAEMDAAGFADMYRERDLTGGHVILLNKEGSDNYDATKQQALSALREWPGGLQVGGGITADNAAEFIDAGASHVIVTSYVFREGRIDRDRLQKLVEAVGAEHIVLDLSCKKTEKGYVIVTDRWQNLTDTVLDLETLDMLADSCSEFLIHAVDVEGKCEGPEEELVELLGSWGRIPVTYAGGIRSFEDIEKIRTLGQKKVDFTIGSALDIFGGSLAFEKVCEID